MRWALDCCRQIGAQVRAAGALALFLDFDGTLTPFRRRPEDVRLDRRTENAIGRLTLHPRVRVWLISARRLADLRARARLPHVHYLGLHGWEGRRPATLGGDTLRAVEAVKTSLSSQLGGLGGIWIEDKWPVFAVHYRGAPEPQICRARVTVRAVTAPLVASIRVMPCKGAWEILPRAIGDKGTAVTRELRAWRPRPLGVYLGDDSSDEPAFAALPDGVTIRVGRPRLTRARFQLRDSREVRIFLQKLKAELS